MNCDGDVFFLVVAAIYSLTRWPTFILSIAQLERACLPHLDVRLNLNVSRTVVSLAISTT